MLLTFAGGSGSAADSSNEELPSPILYELIRFDRFMPQTIESLGGRFGGTWMIDSGRTGKMVIGVVRPTKEDEDRILSLAGKGRQYIRVQPVKYSYDELLQFHDEANRKVAEYGPKGSITVGLRTDLNRVSVELGQDDASLSALLEEELPIDAIATFMRSGIGASTVASRRDYPPYKAGLDILLENEFFDGATCTSAFTMITNGGLTGGLAQGSTAGHCMADTERVFGGPAYAVFIGITNTNTFFCCLPTSNGDGQLIGLANQLDAYNLMYVNSTLDRWVIAHVPNSSLGVGASLCKSGKTTGVTCGTVTLAPPVTIYNVSYYDWDSGEYRTKNIGGLACVNANANHGDSGAPVYTLMGNAGSSYYAGAAGIVAGAAGIVSLKRTDQNGNFIDMCFDTMDNFTMDTGTHVMTFDD